MDIISLLDLEGYPMASSNHNDWKGRVTSVLQSCQHEITRTTSIGKKMFTASKTNGCLHEALKDLGALALKDLRDDKLKWDNPNVAELIDRICRCENELCKIEDDVKELKK